MRNYRPLPSVVALSAALLAGSALAAPDEGLVSGLVSAADAPLPASQVYAYQLGDLTLRKVTTNESGGFAFRNLPAGLYKIIAFKPGFLPGVALLTRASAQAAQFLEVELQSQAEAATDSTADFWTVRQQIPTDVLRDIDLASASSDIGPVSPRPQNLRAEMRAVTGVDSMATTQRAQLSGGQVDLSSKLDNVNVGVSGQYVALEGMPERLDSATANGYSQLVSVNVSGIGSNHIQVISVDNKLSSAETDGSDPIGLQSHRLSWSRDVGERGRSEIAAQYTEEDNFYASGSASRMAMLAGSRTWNLEGSYSTDVGERSSVEAGFRYSDRQLEDLDRPRFEETLPLERVEVFGRAGTAVTPSVLVEYGVYSTMRDGTMSFMPQGGLVMKLGDSWRASTSASLKMHEDPLEARRLEDFHSGYFRDYASCERAAAECYQVVLSRIIDDQEKMSFGAVHRRFDETLRLHFDQNFFNYRENLQLVHGDSVPELQFALTQRLTPNILTRLESNVGAGGGGRVRLAGRPKRYENEVRYMVTSLDTLFEQTATGVFVAFHQLEQRFNSPSNQNLAEEVDLERLQLMLTQDLTVLSSMAADWALQVNMELSRGALPNTEKAVSADEIRQRITGGLAVKF